MIIGREMQLGIQMRMRGLQPSDLEPFLPYGGIGLELVRRAFEHDAAMVRRSFRDEK